MYKATVKSTKANYIGMTSTDFKARYSTHKYSFSNKSKENATALAKYCWDNKMNPLPDLKWEVVKECIPYKPGMKSCDVCLSEKVAIIKHAKDPKNINKRTYLGNRCIHKKKYALGSIKEDIT